MSFSLSGCVTDDFYLDRSASSVIMPTAALPVSESAAPPSRDASVPALKPMSVESASQVNEDQSKPNITGTVSDKRYFVGIGRTVLLNHAGNDFLSAPDIFVRVQRQDQVILRAIDLANEKHATASEQMKVVAKELEPLVNKKHESEITPGKPLSQNRIQRLADLYSVLGERCEKIIKEDVCNDCSRYDERLHCQECRDCDELNFLLELKSASEVVPGPPLNTQEEERMQELEETKARLSTILRVTTQEIRSLWNEITGKTRTITTSGFILDFGFEAIQEVYPDDELWISVYDEDAGQDDMYGSTTIRLSSEILEGGDVKLSMPNVRSLILRIISR